MWQALMSWHKLRGNSRTFQWCWLLQDWRCSRQKYKDLSDQQKCEFFGSIAIYPCISAARKSNGSICTSKQMPGAFHCRVCDSERIISDGYVPWHGDKVNEIQEFLLEFLPKTLRSPPLRISYLLAARRFLYHEPGIKNLSVKSSPIGELCLHSLKAASRELRITTGLVSIILWVKNHSDLWTDTSCLAFYRKLWMFKCGGRTSSSSSSA